MFKFSGLVLRLGYWPDRETAAVYCGSVGTNCITHSSMAQHIFTDVVSVLNGDFLS
jgi:hypothetical protein